MNLKILATPLFVLLFSTLLHGESSIDDFFRSTGKIYTVLGVMIILFVVFIIFLIKVDRRITDLEKQIDNE